MVLTFKYHSLTQRLVHGAPFVLLICLAGWIAYSGGNNELGGYLAAVAFGWLLLANFLINLMISRVGARIGPMDFSPNFHPSRAERVVRWLIFLVSGVVGLAVTVIFLVPGIKVGGLETKLLVGGIIFFLVLAGTFCFLYLAVIVLSGFRIRPPDARRQRSPPLLPESNDQTPIVRPPTDPDGGASPEAVIEYITDRIGRAVLEAERLGEPKTDFERVQQLVSTTEAIMYKRHGNMNAEALNEKQIKAVYDEMFDIVCEIRPKLKALPNDALTAVGALVARYVKRGGGFPFPEWMAGD
jgi:hypothetical protein